MFLLTQATSLGKDRVPNWSFSLNRHRFVGEWLTSLLTMTETANPDDVADILEKIAEQMRDRETEVVTYWMDAHPHNAKTFSAELTVTWLEP